MNDEFICEACKKGARLGGPYCAPCASIARQVELLSDHELVVRGIGQRAMLDAPAVLIYERELEKRGIDEQRCREMELDEEVHRAGGTFFGDADSLVEAALYEGERIVHVARPANPWGVLLEGRNCFDQGCAFAIFALPTCPLGAILLGGAQGASGAEGHFARAAGYTILAIPLAVLVLARLARALSLSNRRYYVTDRRLIVIGGAGLSPWLEVEHALPLEGLNVWREESGRYVDVKAARGQTVVLLERVEEPEELLRILRREP